MPRETCPSVSYPGVAETVDPAGTQFREGEPVLGRPVPAIAPETVTGVGLGEGAHRVVTEDLGNDARSGDRRAPGIGPGQALHLGTEIQVPIREAAPGTRLERGKGPAQGRAVSRADAVAVDPPGRVGHYGDGLGVVQQRAEDFLPQSGRKQFGVVDTGDLSVAEDDGRGHKRPCQRAAAGLIGPRERPASTQDPGRVESVQGTLLRRKTARARP